MYIVDIAFPLAQKQKNIFLYFETLLEENSHMAPEPVTGNLAAPTLMRSSFIRSLLPNQSSP